jgi:hypothetical protein
MAESPFEALRRVLRRESPPICPPIARFDLARLRAGSSRFEMRRLLDLQRLVIAIPGTSRRRWEMLYADTMPVPVPPDSSDTLLVKRYRFLANRIMPSPRRAVPVADDLALLALMPGLPLARGWSGSIQIEEGGFQRAPSADDRCGSRLVPMRVAGERTIATRWGAEPAWRV